VLFESSHTGYLSFGDMIKLFKFIRIFNNYDIFNKTMLGSKEIDYGAMHVIDPLALS